MNIYYQDKNMDLEIMEIERKNKMKVIDLLNKIANGEEVPKKIRVDHWSYKFEWSEHDSNYYDKHEDIDLMSCLSMDKEELNYEVHNIEEPQEHKIPEKLTNTTLYGVPKLNKKELSYITVTNKRDISNIKETINEILDYLSKEE